MTLAGFVTELGDLFSASSVALVVVVWSWLNLNRLVALSFAVCFAATFGLATIIKLWTGKNLPQPYEIPLWLPSAGAPSGHSALAGMVYGCAAAIFLKTGRGAVRIVGATACLAAIAIVSVTRVTLHTHTIPDVVAGLAVAGVFVGFFVQVLDVQAADRSPRLDSLLAAMVVVATMTVISNVRISSSGIL
jgi:membrane-associated phospholipid phosphatase